MNMGFIWNHLKISGKEKNENFFIGIRASKNDPQKRQSLANNKYRKNLWAGFSHKNTKKNEQSFENITVGLLAKRELKTHENLNLHISAFCVLVLHVQEH